MQHTIFHPEDQFSTAYNGWSKLQNILPQYLFDAYRECALQILTVKPLLNEDKVHGRLQLINDRCSSFVLNQMTDLVSNMASTQTEGTFAKLARYGTGASLDQHVDNDLCVWTISMTLNLTSRQLAFDFPLGVVDYHKQPVTSVLEENDGMLIMGHALAHFRKGSPKIGEALVQTFFHYRETSGMLKPPQQVPVSPRPAAAGPTTKGSTPVLTSPKGKLLKT